MKPRFLLCLLLSSLACGLSRAQTPAADEQPVTVEFTLVGWAGEITNLAYRQDGGLVPVTVPAYLRSKVYKYAGPARMGFYLKDAPQDPKQGETPVATVRFEPGVHRYTVLLAGQSGVYLAQAVADDPDKFPIGQARLFNLCPTRMAIRCNQASTLVLAPKQYVLVKPEPNHVLVTQAAYETDGGWRKASDDFVPIRPDEQTSIFFLLSEDQRFRSVDGVARAVQMVILRGKPPASEKPGTPQPGS